MIRSRINRDSLTLIFFSSQVSKLALPPAGGTRHPRVASAPTTQKQDLGGFRASGRPQIVVTVAPCIGMFDSGRTLSAGHAKPSRRAHLEHLWTLRPRATHGWHTGGIQAWQHYQRFGGLHGGIRTGNTVVVVSSIDPSGSE